MKLVRLASVAFLGATMFAVSAKADSVNILADTNNNAGTGGDFSGTVSYDNTTHKLTISLTNLSTVPGLNITGFVFNSADNATATMNPLTDPIYGFKNLTGAGLDAPPFGTFEYGAAIGGDWTGGGSPGDGIANTAGNNTGTFVFDVTGTVGNDVMDFLTQAGDLGKGKNSGEFFIVRFKGNDSDKVPTDIGGVPTPSAGLPLPSAALGGLGLLGCFGLSRRRAR